jgi:hypothetical protein
MTTQNLSGLELARKWMDGLGMRHYGEVDRAIARKQSPEGDSSFTAVDRAAGGLWRSGGFADYASRVLQNRNCLGDDLMQMLGMLNAPDSDDSNSLADRQHWRRTLQTAKESVQEKVPRPDDIFSCTVIGGKAVLENSNYQITAGGGGVDIYNKQADELFAYWRCKNSSLKQNVPVDPDEFSVLTLSDGTELEVVPFIHADSAGATSCLAVNKGQFFARFLNIGRYFDYGLSMECWLETSDEKNHFKNDQHAPQCSTKWYPRC